MTKAKRELEWETAPEINYSIIAGVSGERGLAHTPFGVHMEPGGTARGNASAGAATASSISVDQPSTLTSIDLRIAQLEAELDESSSSSPEGESAIFLQR